jgi:tetraacyldisaccharide 4'-kinase
MSRALHDWTLEWWAGGKGRLGSVADVALAPAEALFASLSATRNAAYERGWLPRHRAQIPVISIGNLTVGGVGKTPFSAWAARQLADWGLSPAIALRGYGSDEALVHAELNPDVPVYAGRRRAEGVARAVEAGRDVVILDDGFQHRAMHRDLDIVLVAAEGWSGRRRLLPRGPWRESITALARASVVVVTRKWASAERSLEIAGELRAASPGLEVATCHMAQSGVVPLHEPESGHPLDWMRGRAALAVASLADPEAFARQLELTGADVELMAFPDHHDFDAADARAILERAGGRAIVMTRKEAVKLRRLLPGDVPALVAEQRVELESEADAVLGSLRRAVGR